MRSPAAGNCFDTAWDFYLGPDTHRLEADSWDENVAKARRRGACNASILLDLLCCLVFCRFKVLWPCKYGGFCHARHVGGTAGGIMRNVCAPCINAFGSTLSSSSGQPCSL